MHKPQQHAIEFHQAFGRVVNPTGWQPAGIAGWLAARASAPAPRSV